MCYWAWDLLSLTPRWLRVLPIFRHHLLLLPLMVLLPCGSPRQHGVCSFVLLGCSRLMILQYCHGVRGFTEFLLATSERVELFGATAAHVTGY